LLVWIIFCATCLMCYYVDLTVEAYRRHLKEGNQVLARLAAAKYPKHGNGSGGVVPLKVRERHHLTGLLAEHTRCTMRIGTINADFTINLTLILLALHVCINIIWLHRLIVVDHLRLYKADLFWPF